MIEGKTLKIEELKKNIKIYSDSLKESKTSEEAKNMKDCSLKYYKTGTYLW